MGASIGEPAGPGAAQPSGGTTGSCVGITIPIPEPLAGKLARRRTSFGDPMGAVVPPHITLITTTPATDWEATVAHVRIVAAAHRPFRVLLKGTGTFRPVSPVVFLNLAEGFDECMLLHEQLQAGPLERELSFPYHPHVTVAHDVSAAGLHEAEQQLEDFEASFQVSTMGLYEHVPSGLWKQREELHLGVTDHSQARSD